MKLINAAIIIAAIFYAGVTTAQTNDTNLISAARPGFAEPASTVDHGIIQFEGGYELDKFGNDNNHKLGNMLIRFGLRKKFELGIGINSYIFSRNATDKIDGFEDASVNMRFTLSTGSKYFQLLRPAAALLIMTSVPSGAGAFSNEIMQPEAKMALNWVLNDFFNLWSTAGYARRGNKSDRFNEFSTVIGLGYGFSEKTGIYAEFFRVEQETNYDSDSNHLQSGFTYLASNDVQLDIHCGKELEAGQSNYFVAFGIAFRIFVKR
ncbi:hypothetical protein AMJ80_03990 [bacterium SM23_31]|nr:MAG: hypothetical protein AMJ80_03990 [bacterium SM23_31]